MRASHSAFIVDDNFIGNKKKAKDLLVKLIPFDEDPGYPLRLTTEASIDLAGPDGHDVPRKFSQRVHRH